MESQISYVTALNWVLVLLIFNLCFLVSLAVLNDLLRFLYLSLPRRTFIIIWSIVILHVLISHSEYFLGYLQYFISSLFIW